METVEGSSRLGIGRVAVLGVALFMLMRMFFMVAGPDRGEAGPSQPTPTVTPTASPFPQYLKPRFAACAELADKVGLYAVADAECRPTKTLTFEELVAISRATKLLRDGENLQRLSLGGQTACAYAVTADNQVWGWLCTDASGLYRVDHWGREWDGGTRWQWFSAGSGMWEPVLP